jgi:hypothetical protein
MGLPNPATLARIDRANATAPDGVPTATGPSAHRPRATTRKCIVQELRDTTTPRQALYREIAGVEHALRETLETLSARLRADRKHLDIANLIARAQALSAQLSGAVNLLGPGADEDATRAVAQGLAGWLGELAREASRSR